MMKDQRIKSGCLVRIHKPINMFLSGVETQIPATSVVGVNGTHGNSIYIQVYKKDQANKSNTWSLGEVKEEDVSWYQLPAGSLVEYNSANENRKLYILDDKKHYIETKTEIPKDCWVVNEDNAGSIVLTKYRSMNQIIIENPILIPKLNSHMKHKNERYLAEESVLSLAYAHCDGAQSFIRTQ